MKKFSVAVSALLVLASANSIFGQCRYAKDETDKFTKKRIIHTKPKILWMSLIASIGIQGKNIEGAKFLTLQIADGGIFSINKGDELNLLLDDGSVVTLLSSEALVADHVNISATTIWSALIDYHVPKKELERLKTATVTSIRVHISGNKYFEHDIKKKHSKNIAKLMQCI